MDFYIGPDGRIFRMGTNSSEGSFGHATMGKDGLYRAKDAFGRERTFRPSSTGVGLEEVDQGSVNFTTHSGQSFQQKKPFGWDVMSDVDKANWAHDQRFKYKP